MEWKEVFTEKQEKQITEAVVKLLVDLINSEEAKDIKAGRFLSLSELNKENDMMIVLDRNGLMYADERGSIVTYRKINSDEDGLESLVRHFQIEPSKVREVVHLLTRVLE